MRQPKMRETDETDETGMSRTSAHPLARANLLADTPDHDVRRMQGVFGLPLLIGALAMVVWCAWRAVATLWGG